MAGETITTDLKNGVLILTLNRPDKLNVYSRTMMQEIVAALDRADQDDAVRVVVFTGAGRAYCGGMDLAEGGDTFRNDVNTHEDSGGVLTLRLYNSHKPVLGAINGPAVGIGATMLLPMDVRVASSRARFGFVFTRRGITPEACSGFFLPRLVGISQAMEWVATGRVFGAEEALRGGLVSRVVEPEDLLPATLELAREIAENTSPVAVALSRHYMWRMMSAAHPMEAHREDSRFIAFMGSGPDAAEGVESFLEKRPARFPLKVSRDLPPFFPWWQEPEFRQ